MKQSNQVKLFKNPVLEFFTKTNFTIHVIWYLLISASYFMLAYYLGIISIGYGVMLSIIGLFLWTLIEYVMHRFVFHFVNENKVINRLHYIFHGQHHELPREEKTTLMPPLPGLIISSILLVLALLFLGYSALYLMSGVIFGYILYSSIHYSIHVYKAPKSLRFLWTHHLLHHYQQPEKAFGVSTTFWDRVFRTMPNRKVLQKSN